MPVGRAELCLDVCNGVSHGGRYWGTRTSAMSLCPCLLWQKSPWYPTRAELIDQFFNDWPVYCGRPPRRCELLAPVEAIEQLFHLIVQSAVFLIFHSENVSFWVKYVSPCPQFQIDFTLFGPIAPNKLATA